MGEYSQSVYNNDLFTGKINSDSLLNMLMNNIPDAIYFKDLNSCYIYLSDAQLKILNLKHIDQAIGKTDFDFLPKKYAFKTYNDEQRIIKTGESIVGDIEEIIDNEGKTRWFSVTKVPIFNKSGETMGIVGISRDITELKCAEDDLMRSEERYKRLLNVATNYDYSVKVENGIPVETKHGPGCALLTGYTFEDYENDSELWSKMIYELDRDDVLEYISRALSGEKISPIEHRIVHKDGSIRWVKNTIVPNFIDGYLVSYDGLIVDITNSKQIEGRYRTIFESSAVAIMLTNDKERIIS